MNPSHLYHYKAYVTRVYSGDTCIVDIDLGMGVWTRREQIQFHRIEAPDPKGNNREAALAARDYLRSMILDREILIKTIKDRKNKTCRYLADMVVVTEQGDTLNVSDALVAAGHATYTSPQAVVTD